VDDLYQQLTENPPTPLTRRRPSPSPGDPDSCLGRVHLSQVAGGTASPRAAASPARGARCQDSSAISAATAAESVTPQAQQEIDTDADSAVAQ
jgi:hypothetical protein